MMAGQIPASAIARHTAGWSDEDAEAFRICIRAIDAVNFEQTETDEPDDSNENAARDAFRQAVR